MRVARHSTGGRAVLGAYASQIHPVFMLPPIAAAAFGAILAGTVRPLPAGIHVVAIFLAVYTAHLKDGYIDFYIRGEDEDTPLTRTGCVAGVVVASLAFWMCLAALIVLVDVWAALLTLPGWIIGYLHAPHLDMSPVTATVGYPLGIAFAILGGYYVQLASISTEAVAFAAVFLILLSGVKVIDDLQDFDWDRRNGKRTVGVTIGIDSAHRVAISLMAVAVMGIVILDLLAVIPSASGLAAIAFAPVLFVARRHGPTVQTMLLIRGSYLFLAVLIAIAWWEPLA